MAHWWPAKRLYQRWWFWVLTVVLGVLVVFVLLVIGAGVGLTVKAHRSHSVVYTVTGSSQETYVQYATFGQVTGSSGSGQVNNTSLPWSKRLTISGLAFAFGVTASTGRGGGNVTCSIAEDGKQLVKRTASGPVATASCSSAGRQ
jgi:hypothetical protein